MSEGQTQHLIEHFKSESGNAADEEQQIILNHREAIKFLIDFQEGVGIEPKTIFHLPASFNKTYSQ